MKKFLIVLLLLIFSVPSYAQSSIDSQMKEMMTLPKLTVYDRNWNEVNLLEKGYYIIDTYCRWCPPCRSNAIALNQAVSDLFNDYETGLALAMRFGANSPKVAIVVAVYSPDKIEEEMKFFSEKGINAIDIYYMVESDLWNYLYLDELPRVVPTTIYNNGNSYLIDTGGKTSDFFYAKLLKKLIDEEDNK